MNILQAFLKTTEKFDGDVESIDDNITTYTVHTNIYGIKRFVFDTGLKCVLVHFDDFPLTDDTKRILYRLGLYQVCSVYGLYNPYIRVSMDAYIKLIGML